MFLFASALALGCLHGLGGDHLMAIAALSVDGAVNGSPAARRSRALAMATRFALGHALLLGVGAGLIVLIGWTIPPHVERGGEMLGGGLLIVMGALTLQHLRRHRALSTPHRASCTEHPAPSTERAALTTEHAALSTEHAALTTEHAALSTERAALSTEHAALSTEHAAPSTEHRALSTEHAALSTEHAAPSTEHRALSTEHSHVPTLIGAAFAVSSLRALAMLTPLGANLGTEPLPVLLSLIGMFSVGILVSMSLFGIALAGLLSTRALTRVGHAASALVGLSSILLGVAWLATA